MVCLPGSHGTHVSRPRYGKRAAPFTYISRDFDVCTVHVVISFVFVWSVSLFSIKYPPWSNVDNGVRDRPDPAKLKPLIVEQSSSRHANFVQSCSWIVPNCWIATASALPLREWTIPESWLLTPDSLETFLRWESESRVTIQDSRVRSQLKSPSENLENFEHFLLIYLVNEALKCWKWSSYSKRYLNMVKVVNKVKDELEKLPHFTVSYGIKIGSDRESWLELESSNLGQGRESQYWNKVTRPFPIVIY